MFLINSVCCGEAWLAAPFMYFQGTDMIIIIPKFYLVLYVLTICFLLYKTLIAHPDDMCNEKEGRKGKENLYLPFHY